MRTTVTLEPDVQALIRKAMKERRISFKEALNSAVRDSLTESRRKGPHFVQRSVSLGCERSFRWDKALEIAAAIEDEELLRKFSLRK
jgi:hypothetical protein